MGLLELVWGDHAEATVEPSSVVPVHPAGGRVVDVAGVRHGPSWNMVVRMHSALSSPLIVSFSAISYASPTSSSIPLVVLSDTSKIAVLQRPVKFAPYAPINFQECWVKDFDLAFPVLFS